MAGAGPGVVATMASVIAKGDLWTVPALPLPALARGEGEGRKKGERSRRLVARLGALRPTGARCGILLGGRVDQREDLVLHRLDPVGILDPGVAVPFGDIGRMVAAVIAARDAERTREADHAELVEARLVDVERFEPAPHVLAGDDLPAGELLRIADALGDDHRVEHAAAVEVLADIGLGGDLAPTLVDHVLDDVL